MITAAPPGFPLRMRKIVGWIAVVFFSQPLLGNKGKFCRQVVLRTGQAMAAIRAAPVVRGARIGSRPPAVPAAAPPPIDPIGFGKYFFRQNTVPFCVKFPGNLGILRLQTVNGAAQVSPGAEGALLGFMAGPSFSRLGPPVFGKVLADPGAHFPGPRADILRSKLVCRIVPLPKERFVTVLLTPI